MKFHKVLLYFTLLLIVLSSSLIVYNHIRDIPLLDEAEFYKASIPKKGQDIYTYYGGEIGGGGFSRVKMNPTWHPAGYLILLREWQNLVSFNFASARFFGIILLILFSIISSIFFYKKKFLDEISLFFYLSLLFSIPLILEGASLLDIDGTVLILLIPLFLLFCNEVISKAVTFKIKHYIFFSIFISILLIFKIIPIILFIFILFLYLFLTKETYLHIRDWALVSFIGFFIFIINWKLISAATDLNFLGPFKDNIGRSSSLIDEIPINKIHIYLTRDIIKIASWVGIAFVLKTLIDFILSMKTIYLNIFHNSKITDKFIFLRFSTFLYVLIYLIIGKAIIYSFPKYILPVIPITIFLIIYDSKKYLTGIKSSFFFIPVLILSFIFISIGNQVEIILNIFESKIKHFGKYNIISLELINITIFFVLIVIFYFYTKIKKRKRFTYELFQYTIFLFTFSFGISSSYYTIKQSGSIIYDYGKNGALETIDYVNKNFYNLGTIVGPLEILYNLNGDDKKYIFDGALYSNKFIIDKIFNEKNLTIILNKNTKNKLIEDYPSLFNNATNIYKSNSYEIISIKN